MQRQYEEQNRNELNGTGQDRIGEDLNTVETGTIGQNRTHCRIENGRDEKREEQDRKGWNRT